MKLFQLNKPRNRVFLWWPTIVRDEAGVEHVRWLEHAERRLRVFKSLDSYWMYFSTPLAAEIGGFKGAD